MDDEDDSEQAERLGPAGSPDKPQVGHQALCTPALQLTIDNTQGAACCLSVALSVDSVLLL